jgi:hypothetical protein
MSSIKPALEISFPELVQVFKINNIATGAPGFYDLPNFLKKEQVQPDFLENYAAFVQLQAYPADYLTKAAIEIPVICGLLHQELLKDGRLGACVDMSIGLSRILEAEGYWNYIVKGSISIKFPPEAKLPNRYFWSYDINFNYAAAHAWVVAPPFTILDLTLKQQPLPQGDEKWLPDHIIHKDFERSDVEEIDLISPDLALDMTRRGYGTHKIEMLHPNFPTFNKIFKPNVIKKDGLELKYIAAKIGAPDEPLERVGTLNLNGRRAVAIYDDIIKPALAAIRKNH